MVKRNPKLFKVDFSLKQKNILSINNLNLHTTDIRTSTTFIAASTKA